ncbi:MAG: D-aminoacyl-tRNA deacylase [Patescibacteria group bacterium]|nr:D-aminoacyl-tRNA deacylase [Patescibacteria group bacterium]
MIVVIQRVIEAEVRVENKLFSKIGRGYLVLVGFCKQDTKNVVIKMAEKIANLRIMADQHGKMNLNLLQASGELLLVSQFTLCADTSQRRPSFLNALEETKALDLYKLLIKSLLERGIKVKTGHFGHYMEIRLINDGPVTIILNSKNFKLQDYQDQLSPCG